MALIKCPECGKEVSEKAEKCVNCGNPLKKRKIKEGKKIKKIWVIVVSVVLALLLFPLLFRLFSPFIFVRINGSSMEPALSDGEIKIVNRLAKIKRFDVICIERDDESYVKRVYGLPGETIMVDTDSSISVNGEKIKNKYAHGDSSKIDIMPFSVTLAEDEYFVLGDDIETSFDSRKVFFPNTNTIVTLGEVTKKEIIGVITGTD